MKPKKIEENITSGRRSGRWLHAALFVASFALMLLEFGLMRLLAERFWSHFAGMVIGVAMLGCGISGALLAVIRARSASGHAPMSRSSMVAFALTIPPAIAGAGWVKLNPLYITWDAYQSVHLLTLEFVTLLPFVAGSLGIAACLIEAGEGVGAAYAAGFFGSGAGAVFGMSLLFWITPVGLLWIAAWLAFAAAWMLGERGDSRHAAILSVTGIVLAGMYAVVPAEPAMSEYKALPVFSRMAGTCSIHAARSPLGRIDVLEGPNIHLAPGLELGYRGIVPSHSVLLTDGDQPVPVYHCRDDRERAFLDRLTSAAAYSFLDRPEVLIVGVGGGSDIHQAVLKKAGSVTALELDEALIGALRGPLRERSGNIASLLGVVILNREARNYLATTRRTYDLIQISLVDALGIAGAGLRAGQESYLFTVEAFEDMVRCLKPGGVISVTRWAEVPPRDALKIVDAMALALERAGAEPASNIVMIRNWATVTILCFRNPPAPAALTAIRSFCAERSFDVCRMPGSVASGAIPHHRLDRPWYEEGAEALLGVERKEYISAYPFRISAATDDRPYFYHFLKWSRLPDLFAQFGNRARPFVELGSLLMVLALIQAVVLTFFLLLFPIVAVRGRRGLSRRNMASLGYFCAIGAGYMLLEMGCMQKLVLFLGHPVYSAATVIAGFLVFSGLGSLASDIVAEKPEKAGMAGAAAVALIAASSPWLLDGAIHIAMRLPDWQKFPLGMLFIVPLAFPMGIFFPLGFRHVLKTDEDLAPWAWGANGFASVLATLGAPLLAMQIGFTGLAFLGAACYLSISLYWYLHRSQPPVSEPPGLPGSPTVGTSGKSVC